MTPTIYALKMPRLMELHDRYAEKGLIIKIIQELNSIEQVKRYVELNLGVTILDEFNLRQRDEATLNIYPLDQHFGQRRYGIITRKRQYISPALEAFMQTIKGERDGSLGNNDL